MSESKNSWQMQYSTSFLSGGSAAYLDELYEQYLQNPASVPEEWRKCFTELPQVNGTNKEVSHEEIRAYFRNLSQEKRVMVGAGATASTGAQTDNAKVLAFWQLVQAYRQYGHQNAQLDPLNLWQRPAAKRLEPGGYGLTSQDLQQPIPHPIAQQFSVKTGAELVKFLQKVYCGHLAAEYLYVTDVEQVAWFQQRLEKNMQSELTKEEKITTLKNLIAAEGLEKYLGAKYVGQKRFSLEGGDSLMPLMQRLVDGAAQHSVKEIVIGMAHRGRLNVLINLLGKSPSKLFDEFEGKAKDVDATISGDVKYHKGFSSDVATPNGNIHLSLAFNPSHLEIINPVVEGAVRARQGRRGDKARQSVIPVLIHGDAAFAGQGVVMETLNLSQVRGYCTGGTIHVIVNNQIGFTTSELQDARSTPYCSDVAKMIEAPILHVNGDDPEQVVRAAQLAIDFRMHFKRDIVIDLVCYRRHGHNEADEPAVTQPKMYELIRKHPTPYEIYRQQLVSENVVRAEEVDTWVENYRDQLDAGKPVVNLQAEGLNSTLLADWKPFLDQQWRNPVKTGVKKETLKRLAELTLNVPSTFSMHPQVEKLWQERKKMAEGQLPLNWGYAEIMAYASLLNEGYSVRLSGQDCGRGTFAHRHAVLHDVKNDQAYIPLSQVCQSSSQVEIIDSVLSEEAVLAFEYGFATAEPNGLILWEAQFGDFANGAQVVIDQFLSSGEQKWGRLCGLVMLLPHGYEGQGPEHSSARLERYMQLCAQHNIQVCVPSTPAQFFHLLRRQMVRPFRKPLIVMTPKSLLRHKLAVSSLQELEQEQFKVLIPEIDELNDKNIQRVVLCSGKLYYELLQKRREEKKQHVALIRIEQLYPFGEIELQEQLQRYKKVKDIVWCQEEPQNQGAWYAIQHHLQACLSNTQSLRYVGRPFSASPAAGSLKLHIVEQTKLIDEALA